MMSLNNILFEKFICDGSRMLLCFALHWSTKNTITFEAELFGGLELVKASAGTCCVIDLQIFNLGFNQSIDKTEES